MSEGAAEAERFEALKPRLREIWQRMRNDPGFAHTSVIVPSLSVNQEELAKVTGAAYYEERLLFSLIRLRNPNATLVYVTSQPVHPDIVEYYLQQLEGLSGVNARRRLHLMSVYDSSARALTEKVLERPRLLRRIRQCIHDPQRAYLTCYNSTVLERRLALALDIPLNGVDPELLSLGDKSGNRKVFAEAGVDHPAGFEDLRAEDEIVQALLRLRARRPGLKRAVVKLNEGFGGEGNGVFTYPEEANEAGVREALQNLAWVSPTETPKRFLHKFGKMGGIVEEMVAAPEVRSPSVQMRIFPDGQAQLVSSHEQVLGGSTGQAYLGCRFPALDEYRRALQENAWKVARVLSAHGVIGRFAIDFLVAREPGEDWRAYAIEINLRMGGTTTPYQALESLTRGRLEPDTGLFRAPDGQVKFYAATDNLRSSAYRGLLPEDLFSMFSESNLAYRHSTGTGVLFYMVGALSQFGKLGMTCIGDSREDADRLFEQAVDWLDSHCEGRGHGRAAPLLDRFVPME